MAGALMEGLPLCRVTSPDPSGIESRDPSEEKKLMKSRVRIAMTLVLSAIHLRPTLHNHRRAVVFVSGYCGNLCRHFITYKVVEGPWQWRVVGTVGGIGIS
jgi:hypothetical protein